MKKSTLLALTVFSINAAIAQTNTAVPANTNEFNPPSSVSTKFQNDYPNTTANWVVNGDNYSAEYKDANTNMGKNIVYDMNGKIVSSDSEMGTGAYPVAIGDYYTKNYPKEFYTVWSSDDANGNKTYYSKGKENIFWFDKDGKYVSKKPISNSKKTKTKTKK